MLGGIKSNNKSLEKIESKSKEDGDSNTDFFSTPMEFAYDLRFFAVFFASKRRKWNHGGML